MNTMNTKKDYAGYAAKGWFCTWPHCPLKKEEVLDMLSDRYRLDKYVIAEEKHADGQPHLHAFLKLFARKKFNAAMFDLGEYHGNYQPAKSWRCVEQYCKKDGNYITNEDIDNARHKKAKRNMELIKMDPKEAVEGGYIGFCALPSFIKAKREWKNLEEVPLFIERKCFWIWGEPRLGKSYACRSAYPELYEKPQNKWWDGYQGETAVLLDDFDKQGACLGHYLKIWADNYRFNAEVKGGMLRPCYTVLMVTSNYTPDQIFTEDKELCDAIAARFQVIKLENRAGQDELLRKIRTKNN